MRIERGDVIEDTYSKISLKIKVVEVTDGVVVLENGHEYEMDGLVRQIKSDRSSVELVDN